MTTPRLGVWWLVAAGLAAGLVLMVAGDGQVRLGGYLVAAALGLAAVLRAVLPRRLAGGLEVRSRLLDVMVLAGLAAAVALLVTVVDLRPRR